MSRMVQAKDFTFFNGVNSLIISIKKPGISSRVSRLAGDRTPDPMIKSHVLYQLSYEPFEGANKVKIFYIMNFYFLPG
jgi:hypothetical protein